jgi:hypothetical protein
VTEPTDDTEQLAATLLGGVNTSNLADALSFSVGRANAKPDFEFHQGQVIEWDSTTGENLIHVLGSDVADIPSLSTGDNVLLYEGDVVAVLKYKYNYFVLGRVTPAGTAGALGLRTAQTSPLISVTDTAYSTSVYDPVISDVRIGSSGRALVFVRSLIRITGGEGYVGIRVIQPSGTTLEFDVLMLGTTSETVQTRGVVTGIFMFDASSIILEPGVLEFGLVYRVSDLGTAGSTYQVASRQIIVTPY